MLVLSEVEPGTQANVCGEVPSTYCNGICAISLSSVNVIAFAIKTAVKFCFTLKLLIESCHLGDSRP